MSQPPLNPHQRKVFEEDAYLEDIDYHSDEDEDSECNNVIEKKIEQKQNKAKKKVEIKEEPQDEENMNLEQLIQKLNHEDHSEDQGIEDYKIGGYHPCHIGEVLSNRYVLVQKLGWGHFSTVWLAKDFKYGNYVAVKIMKSSPHYLEASYDQVEILQKVAQYAYHPQWIKSLKEYEPNKEKYDRDDCHVLNLLNSFLYKGPYGNHFCMVFEILGVNLLEVLKRYDYKGLPLDLVKEITRQVLMGLDFLNRICRVIHTDLKPQNVLLCLTDQEIKQIVEQGQLSNQELYEDRLNLYRQQYGLGPTQSPDVSKQPSPQKSKEEETDDIMSSTFSEQISELTEKLEDSTLTKNQRKTYKRKLKKLQEKANEEKQQERALKKEEKEKDKLKKKKKKTRKQLFSAFSTKLVLDKGPKLEKGFKVKIADLGNACWEHHHFATQIQTRQYRSPQVLLGSKYNLSADMWSLACMTFEMLTGELLFNPRKDTNESFGKNDDHIAQMMQLLGRFPKKFSLRGIKARKYFGKDGNMNRIPKLQNWSLKDVMIAKYKFTEEQATYFQEFMMPMLNCYPQRRLLSDQVLKHPWLRSQNPDNYFMSTEQHEKIKAQKYDLTGDIQKDEFYQYESENEDGDLQDNRLEEEEDEDDFYQYEKIGDIRYIDRSFMDLGYIGYGDGIFLEKLDFGPNWQFEA